MKAAVLHEVNKPLVIEDVSLPKPGPREVLIRTSVAGLCHSDLHFMEGLYPHPLPAVLGHESAGVVEQVGRILHARQAASGGLDLGQAEIVRDQRGLCRDEGRQDRAQRDRV
jgi:D-arabinose 1-dehydrogenase-like Zn-dependent alcohol dehydrogenase